MANLATRLCLSGVESRRLLDTFKEFGVPHIQVSYYYLRRVFQDPLDFEEFCTPFTTVLIDSGTVYHKFKTTEEEQAFLKDYAGYIGGLNKRAYTAAVYEGGSDIEKVLPEEMLIYPIDQVRSVFDNNIDHICREVKYLGIGNDEKELERIFAHAKKHGTYIHGFATSSKKLLHKHPYYSANSSSWRSGSRYLNTYIYQGPSRGARLFQPTDKSDPQKTEKELTRVRRQQQRLVKTRQPHIYDLISWDEVFDSESWEVDKANLSQWMLYQRDLELWGQNKYWLTEKGKQELIIAKRNLLANLNKSGEGEDDETEHTHREERARETDGQKGPDEEALYNRPPIQEGAPANREGREEQGGIEDADIVEGEIVDTDIVRSPDTPLEMRESNISLERVTPIDDRMRVLRKCDMCSLADRCSKYTAGGFCAYGLPPESPTYDHTNMDQHLAEDFADVMAMQKDRIMQLYLEEKSDASGVNPDLRKEVKLWAEVVALYREAMSNYDSVSIKAKGPNVIDMFKPRR